LRKKVEEVTRFCAEATDSGIKNGRGRTRDGIKFSKTSATTHKKNNSQGGKNTKQGKGRGGINDSFPGEKLRKVRKRFCERNLCREKVLTDSERQKGELGAKGAPG